MIVCIISLTQASCFSGPIAKDTSNCNKVLFCTEGQLALLRNRINETRQEGAYCGSQFYKPVASLSVSKQLKRAAHSHVQEMAENNFFAHKGLNNSVSEDRVNATRYKWQAMAENLAAGQYCVDDMLKSWMTSKGHCENIMSNKYSEIGLACSTNLQSKYKVYWSSVLAKPR